MTKYIGFLIGLGVLCATIVGISFTITGSPGVQKYINLDRKRISDFDSLKYIIDSYYQQYGQAPASLQELVNMANLPLTDPETNMPYVYRKDSVNSYSLCTVFSTDSSESGLGNNYYSGTMITFSKGYNCIPYTITVPGPTPINTPSPTYTVSRSSALDYILTPTLFPTYTPPVTY